MAGIVFMKFVVLRSTTPKILRRLEKIFRTFFFAAEVRTRGSAGVSPALSSKHQQMPAGSRRYVLTDPASLTDYSFSILPLRSPGLCGGWLRLGCSVLLRSKFVFF